MPEEFQLSAYEDCSTWGAKEWAAALLSRLSIREYWRWACLDGLDERVPNRLVTSAQVAARGMLFNPLNPSVEAAGRNGFGLFNYPSPIHDQSAADFFKALYKVDDPRYTAWVTRATYMRVDDDDNEELAAEVSKLCDTPAWKMHAECTNKPYSIFISVDFGASDDYLIKEFKTWLKKTRKEIGAVRMPRQFNDKDFSSWHAQRLLPYLDLTFWAATHGGYFSQATIGQMLFPDDLNRSLESLIRKTVRPNALGLVSKEAVSALNAQLHLPPRKPGPSKDTSSKSSVSKGRRTE